MLRLQLLMLPMCRTRERIQKSELVCGRAAKHSSLSSPPSHCPYNRKIPNQAVCDASRFSSNASFDSAVSITMLFLAREQGVILSTFMILDKVHLASTRDL